MESFSCETIANYKSSFSEFLISLYCLAGICAVLENAVVIVTILLTPSLKTKANILLVNIALTDVSIGLICVPFSVVNIHFGTETPCSVVVASKFFSTTFCAASVNALCIINLDRYFHCSKLNLYQIFMNRKKLFFFVTVSWIPAVIYGFVFISVNARIVYYAVVCVTFQIPMTITVWCYLRINKIINDSQKRLSEVRKYSKNAEMSVLRASDHKHCCTDYAEKMSVFEKQSQKQPVSVQIEIPTPNKMKENSKKTLNRIRKCSDDNNDNLSAAILSVISLNNEPKAEPILMQSKIPLPSNITKDSKKTSGEQNNCYENVDYSFSKTCGETKPPAFEHKLSQTEHSSTKRSRVNPFTRLKSKQKERKGIKRDYNIAKTVFVLLMLYVISWTPFVLTTLMRAVKIYKGADISVYTDIIQWTLLLGYFNSMVNPFIYYFRQRNIRNGTIAMFRKCKVSGC